ncbi:MAG: hypothetical protein HY901_34240, partial [Deltaproteobacteria bacterium]|nr:hypothetical protein [Deltaproteobacteria bacterium]
MSLTVATAIAASLLLAGASGRKPPQIIDVEALQRQQQEPLRRTHQKTGRTVTSTSPAADLQLVMNDSETNRSLSPMLIERLTGLGYVVSPEVDYGKLGKSRNAKAVLRFEVVRMDGTCLITAKAFDLKSPEISFWRWETQD